MNKKDLKRFKAILEDQKRQILVQAKKTLTEESSFDTDDLPDEIDLASSEYSQSMIFRLRDREKFLLNKINTRADFRMTRERGRERESWNIPWRSATHETDTGWQVSQASVFDLKSNRLRPEGWTSADAAGLPIFPNRPQTHYLRRKRQQTGSPPAGSR